MFALFLSIWYLFFFVPNKTEYDPGVERPTTREGQKLINQSLHHLDHCMCLEVFKYNSSIFGYIGCYLVFYKALLKFPEREGQKEKERVVQSSSARSS